MTTMTTKEGAVSTLRERLSSRLDELRARLANELSPPAEATLGAIAGEVRDSGDESVAIEHADVRTALMQRDARELDDLRSALVRLDGGNYGVCIECELEIEPARLGALPTAQRCSVCQEAFEHRSALTTVR